MPSTAFRSRRGELSHLRSQLRDQGWSYQQIAHQLKTSRKVGTLQAFRMAHGMTQDQVAEKYNEITTRDDRILTGQQVCYWEAWPRPSGRQPTLADLCTLAQIFLCDVRDLLEPCDFSHLDPANTAPDETVPEKDNHDTAPETAPEEGNTTERRDFLRSTTVTTVVAVSAVAAETSRQIVHADPDPITLGDIEDDVDRFAALYATTPHSALFPQVERRWTQVDRALAGRTSLTAHQRLTSAAGRLSCFLGHLAFNGGDFTAARRFSVLAEQYARQTDDLVILGSVAGVMSSIAYYQDHYEKALAVFRDYPADPPYLIARNAAYRARAHGRLGNIPAAKAELDLMRHHVRERAPQPGDLPFTEAASWMITAVTLSLCGEGEQAEPFARQSIAAHESTGSGQAPQLRLGYGATTWAHAHLALAFALLHREHPAVDEAAAAIAHAVDLANHYPTHTVLQRAGDLVKEMCRTPRPPALATDLRKRLSTAPPASPAPA